MSNLEEAKQHAKTNLDSQVKLTRALMSLTETESRTFETWYQPLFEQTALTLFELKNSKK